MGDKTVSSDSYVLGTDNSEIDRLALQDRVWKDNAVAAWLRAGLLPGKRVIDLGCGPGFAAQSLAEITTSSGSVCCVEGNTRFLELARSRVEETGVAAQAIHGDLDTLELPKGQFDFAWCRWVASFVRKPERLVSQVADCLVDGGVAVFHEYLDYSTWRLLPRVDAFEELVVLIMQSWRNAGGEPDIAAQLPVWLEQSGLSIEIKPLLFTAVQSEPMWQWPIAFIEASLKRLIELELLDSDEARRIHSEIQSAIDDPHTRMVTPLVAEIIARKR